MNAFPMISIIIPVYNGSNYLSEAIESALAQTYSNVEIIVVNDGSNDDGQTEAIALSYGEKIHYIKKSNGGVSSALNLGISQMTGEYFSWLSHDDKYTETKIEAQVKLLQNHSGQKVVALCGCKYINKESEIMAYQPKDRFLPGKYEWDIVLNDLFGHGTYNGCAFLIPKKFFDECGGFDEDLRFSQDTLMWAKLFLSKCAIIYDNSIGVLSRLHEGQQTQKSRHLIVHDGQKIAEYILPVLIRENLHKSLYLFAKRNAMLNNGEVVRMCMKRGKMTYIEILKVSVFSIYGKIRPIIRKVYYSIFKEIKTK